MKTFYICGFVFLLLIWLPFGSCGHTNGFKIYNPIGLVLFSGVENADPSIRPGWDDDTAPKTPFHSSSESKSGGAVFPMDQNIDFDLLFSDFVGDTQRIVRLDGVDADAGFVPGSIRVIRREAVGIYDAGEVISFKHRVGLAESTSPAWGAASKASWVPPKSNDYNRNPMYLEATCLPTSDGPKTILLTINIGNLDSSTQSHFRWNDVYFSVNCIAVAPSLIPSPSPSPIPSPLSIAFGTIFESIAAETAAKAQGYRAFPARAMRPNTIKVPAWKHDSMTAL